MPVAIRSPYSSVCALKPNLSLSCSSSLPTTIEPSPPVADDLTDWRCRALANDLNASVLIRILAGKTFDGFRQRREALCRRQGRCLLQRLRGLRSARHRRGLCALSLRFGGAANFDHCNAAGEFRQTFLQFFTIVVRCRFFDLLANLVGAAFDLRIFHQRRRRPLCRPC